MRVITRPMPHCDVFEKLIKKGYIHFHETSLDKLEDFWVRTTVRLYLDGGMKIPSLKWKLGDTGVRDQKTGMISVCVKVEDDIIKYLDIYPCTEQFMFIKDEEHHESIHPDEYMLQAMTKIGIFTEGRVIVDEEGRSILEGKTKDGRDIRMVDSRKRNKGEVGLDGISISMTDSEDEE